MDQSRFFREVARLARKHSFDSALTADGRMDISHNGKPLCRINGKGGVLVHDNLGEMMSFYVDAMDARDYITAIEAAPPLAAEGLPDGYRLLCEQEKTVLAGKDMGAHGFQFVTWDWDFNRTGLDHGHYHDSYIAAKEDFAFRSRLMLEHWRFSPEQAKELHNVICMALDRNMPPDQEAVKYLRECVEKLEQSHPQLAERDRPAEVRSIRGSAYAIEDIVGGSLDTPGWGGDIRLYFNEEMNFGDYDDGQLNRILPDGAVVGPLVIVSWDKQKKEITSLTPEQIEEQRAIMDAPEHQPGFEQSMEPTMEL